MRMADWQGKILTVMGPIQPEDAGVTLAHEHLVCNSQTMMKKTTTEFPELAKRPITPDIGWWLTHNPYSSFDNMHLDKEKEAVRDELIFFQQNGGGTIVENTTIGIQPGDQVLSQVLANLSMASGVKIVCSTGFYVESSRAHYSETSTEDFVDYMLRDIVSGCDGTGIKAGVLGELGCDFPIEDSERRVLEAAAHIETDTGIPVIIHPGRNEQSPFEIMRIYQEAGGHADRVVMSHMDRTIADPGLLVDLAKTGCYLDYDMFGIETSYYQPCPTIDMPSDAERIRRIRMLIDEGYGDQITVGHDIHTKHRLMKYGGHGYSHILLHVVPKMLQRGISQESIDKILKSNPQRWLMFNKHN